MTDTSIATNFPSNTFVKFSSPLGCQQVACLSTEHIMLVAAVTILMVQAVLLKYLSSTLESSWPNHEYLRSKYGHVDNMHNVIFALILCWQLFFVRDSTEGIRNRLPVYFLICSFLFFIDSCVQATTSPFYSGLVNGLRLGESLVCLLFSLYSLLILNLQLVGKTKFKMLFK